MLQDTLLMSFSCWADLDMLSVPLEATLQGSSLHSVHGSAERMTAEVTLERGCEARDLCPTLSGWA